MSEKRLIGEKAILRSITMEDTPLIVKWRSLPSVYNHLYTRGPLLAEQHIKWMQTRVMTGQCHQFIIEDAKTGMPVGSVFIKNIDCESKKGEYGIFIGEEAARGRGIGSDAARLILSYGFKEIGLNRIYLSVFAKNRIAIESYKRAGFREEGMLREDYYADGQYDDILLMSILRKEWEKAE